jgi:hypothetical protein
MMAAAMNAELAVIILAGAASLASASDLRTPESFSSIADKMDRSRALSTAGLINN